MTLRILLPLLTILCPAIPFIASAQQTVTEDGVEYILHEDGTAAVSKVHNNYWEDHYEGIEIPATITGYDGHQYQVTTFGNDSPVFDHEWHNISYDFSSGLYGEPWYRNNDFLESCPSRLDNISLPETITKIGKLAFAGCNSLTSIYIPENVTFVDSCAFIGCYNLKKVHTPDCHKWHEINFAGNGWDSYANPLHYAHQLYENSEKLNEFRQHYMWFTKIGDYAFHSWDGTNAEFYVGVEQIGQGAFSSCQNLEYITLISHFADSISAFCFNDCKKLKHVELLTPLKRIGKCAFQNCQSLTEIELPSSITTIKEGAFYQCIALKSIQLPIYIKTIESGTFTRCLSLESIYIPSLVTNVGEASFYECNSLEDITTPNNVLTIERAAFNNCQGLCSITFEESNSKLTYIDNIRTLPAGDSTLFGNSPIEKIYFGRNISESFRGSLYKLPTLKTLEFGGGATEILPEMFSDCAALEEVILSKSIQSIGSKTFASAKKIKRIRVEAVEPPVVSADAFSPDIYASAELSVPASSMERYKAAPVWQNFIKMTDQQGSVGIVDTGARAVSIEVVDGICIVNGAEIVRVYNVSGAEVYSGTSGHIELPAGIFVVVADSLTKKIRI